MIEIREAQDLLTVVQELKSSGHRLCQICATLVDESIEVIYTFEKDNVLANYKFVVDARHPELESVTEIYHYAFIYENEMHDLFGITFKNLALDYSGNFFKVAVDTPWNPLFGKVGEN